MPKKSDFNKLNQLIGKGLTYPLGQLDNSIFYIYIDDKESFLSMMHINEPHDLYRKCPFFVSIARKKYLSIIKPPVMDKYELNREFAYYHNEAYEIIADTLIWQGMPSLSFINSLAGYNYEGQKNNGYIYFYMSLTNSSNNIIFQDPEYLSFKNIKLVRKLLEMTDKNRWLLCNWDPNSKYSAFYGWRIAGLGKGIGEYNAMIHFYGNAKWRMTTSNEYISYDGGRYTIRHINAPSEQERSNADEIEKITQFYTSISIDKKKSAEYIEVFEKLLAQKHGTMLIISNNAQSEAKRFSNAKRGISVKPFDLKKLDDETLLNISNIDGAILMDPNCICYALGIIVDGYIPPEFEGDSGRGARYNSAKLYIHNIKSSEQIKRLTKNIENTPEQAMAIVISEDGYLNVFSSTETSGEYN